MEPIFLQSNVICRSCKQPFICNPANIAACGCSKIELTNEELAYISQKYNDCICNSCLLMLKREYHLLN